MEPCLLAGDNDDPNSLVKCCREDLCNYVHMDMVLQMKTKPEQGPGKMKIPLFLSRELAWVNRDT